MRGKSAAIGIGGPLALVALFAVSSVALAAPGPFVGAWESIDTDGSYQRLVIGGGAEGSHKVQYYDYGATVCGTDPDTGEILHAALAMGDGGADGNVLVGEWDVWCLAQPVTFFGHLGFEFTYDSASETLTDGFGVVWNRK